MELKDLKPIIDHYREELASLRTNRATPILVENIKVEAYSSKLPLKQLATISTPDPKTIVIQPFDKTVIKAIEEALAASDLGINPTNEGSLLRVVIPPMTEERREELIKIIGQKTEMAKVNVRKKRDEEIRKLKNEAKEKVISEDFRYKEEKEIQTVIDEAIGQISDLAANKETELRKI